MFAKMAAKLKPDPPVKEQRGEILEESAPGDSWAILNTFRKDAFTN